MLSNQVVHVKVLKLSFILFEDEQLFKFESICLYTYLVVKLDQLLLILINWRLILYIFHLLGATPCKIWNWRKETKNRLKQKKSKVWGPNYTKPINDLDYFYDNWRVWVLNWIHRKARGLKKSEKGLKHANEKFSKLVPFL